MIVRIIVALIVLAALFLVLRLLAWCLTDVLGDGTLTQYDRSMWLAFLLILSAVAAPLYVTVGPGRDRWDSSRFWPW